MMAPSFLQRLFGQKKRGSDAGSLSFRETVKGVVKPETPSGGVADQEDRKGLEKPVESGPAVENIGAMTSVNSLFAFADPKDPFTAGEIAGEQLPGPILSIMSAKQFGHLFLFHTPHTRENAVATEKEVSDRYPECQIVVNELTVSDPKDYSSVMGRLARTVRRLMKLGSSEIADCYVCVSSGTAEMRAAWFLLAALGVLPARMLQVGSPARPLFGAANVKEVRMDSSDWLTIQALAMPDEYFRADARESVTKPESPSIALGRARIPSWLQQVTKQVEGKPKAGEETLGFDKAFVERMRTQYGDALPEFLLPRLREKIQRNKAFAAVFSADEIQNFAQEAFRKFAAALRREGGSDHPERFGGLANSVCNDVLVDYCRPSTETQSMEDFEGQTPEVLRGLKLTPKQLETVRREKESLRDEAAEEAPKAGEEEFEYFGEPPREETPSLEGARDLIAPEALAIPGLDD